MRRTLLAIPLLLLLTACGGAADPAAVAPTAAATATLVTATTVASSATATTAATPTIAPPPVSGDAPLTGPVIAFTTEDGYEDTSLGLFDTATGA